MQSAEAADIQFKVGAGQQYFSGKSLQSLSPNKGTILTFAAGSGSRSILRWVSNMTLLSSSGTADFSDSGTSQTLSYALIGGEFNYGVQVAPMASFSKLPIQPYFGVTGALQMDTFTFTDNGSLSSTFPKTSSGQFFGYNIQVGVGINMTKRGGLYIEVEQSTIAGQIAEATFNLNGNRIIIGWFMN